MQAVSTTVTYDGEGDVMKFLFVSENIIMQGKSNDEKASQVLCHLIDSAFDFYYATYSHDCVLVEAASHWTAIRASLIGRFAVEERPGEDIQREITGRLDEQNLEVSLVGMDRTFNKAGVNDIAKFGLLRNADMEHRDVAQFAMYRSPTVYSELKKAVTDFAAGRNAFRAARPSQSSQNQVRVLTRNEAARSGNIEHNVEALTNQLAELSLMIAKKSTGVSQADRSNNWSCSFWKEQGHYASRCSANPYRDARCPKCGKIGYSTDTCWAKYGRNGTHHTAPASKSRDHTGSKQVTFIAESADRGLVAADITNAEGEAIQKQGKLRDEVTIPRLPNPSSTVRPGIPWAPSQLPFDAPIARKPKRMKKITWKAALQEHVGKYNVVSELARAPSGLTFGRLVRGDAEAARREINGLLERKARRRPGFAGPVELRPRRLRVTTVSVYGTAAHALLDWGQFRTSCAQTSCKRYT